MYILQVYIPDLTLRTFKTESMSDFPVVESSVCDVWWSLCFVCVTNYGCCVVVKGPESAEV